MQPSTQRATKARDTRRRVITAANGLFLEVGYPTTTIREVAERAGVSQETVYKTFGSKAGLLKAAYDVAMAGDDDPIPISQRPESRAVASAATPAEAVAAYVNLAKTLILRAGQITRVVLSSRGASEDVEAFAAVIDGERLIGTQGVMRHWASKGWLRPGLTAEDATDIVWVFISPAVINLFYERGWSIDRYVDCLTDALTRLIVAPTR